MIEKQNQGLASELGGYQFKPRINQNSLDLSATMKSLAVRMPEMLSEREKFLESERKKKIQVCQNKRLNVDLLFTPDTQTVALIT